MKKSYKVEIYVPGKDETLKVFAAGSNQNEAGINAKDKLRKKFGYSNRKLYVQKINSVK